MSSDPPVADRVLVRVGPRAGVPVERLLAYGSDQVAGLVYLATCAKANVVESAYRINLLILSLRESGKVD